ncbi:hypothetical protein C1X84_26590 [Pseudomonas sp. GP01-A1]|nr:hypothetical protein C1X90_30015 [Pseudomonas sp. GP01-A9]PMU46589.1 hypothetical protein C1X87_25120 [Pseudomonas sp. GP01-A14]PMU49047.1 hypothetical protein C1X85_28385 [Pseudomonas sp. GP01-A6]PMU69119.1 hypothetical protein C1X84_26590 [Pseudomonas sp. GP01-A1]PMU71970.1 hypothetical protein C1X81_18265 [Pseudomonas sp. FW215-L2]PMV01070.1 hypothetical protein C1X82_30835 [Pseudomonas sp. GP01-A11]PMV08308.1 hypothetical protein C1X83_22910 [Pseudomonas sp. GP01-A4]
MLPWPPKIHDLKCDQPVGAGLPAIAMVNPTPLSQASQLPQLIFIVLENGFQAIVFDECT